MALHSSSTTTIDSSSSSLKQLEEVRAILTCPISHELMRDPVTLVTGRTFGAGQTFDRQSLCQCLLQNPTKCPMTNQKFDSKLQYVENIVARQILTTFFGNNQYQKYDDSNFRHQYAALIVTDSSDDELSEFVTDSSDDESSDTDSSDDESSDIDSSDTDESSDTDSSDTDESSDTDTQDWDNQANELALLVRLATHGDPTTLFELAERY